MKRLWQRCGNVAFWLSWPGSWLYLHIGSRTRILVVAGDELLVVKPWLGSGKWILPGGGLHRHEDPLLGALRELREEAGLALHPEDLQQLYRATYREYGFVFPYTCYVARLAHKPPLRRQMLEIIDMRWLPISEANHDVCQDDVVTALAKLGQR